MVDHDLRQQGITDARVLNAMEEVQREAFVPEPVRRFAYANRPLPIGHEQTISQPYIVALMLEAARIAPGDRALEVGAGSGYAAAVLGRLAAEVIAIERIPALVQSARAALEALGAANVTVIEGDGTQGWPDRAPYDVIIVSAGGPSIPEPLRRQLAPGGRLVIPVGPDQFEQSLIRLTRVHDGEVQRDDLGAVAFVPLIGAAGWPEP